MTGDGDFWIEATADMKMRRMPTAAAAELEADGSHAPPVLISLGEWTLTGYGFGLGFATPVDEDATSQADHNGAVWWPGIANTFFWIDPRAPQS